MLVEILLLILIGTLSLGSYKIIKRLILVDSKINELYETRHQMRELHHHIDETLHRIRDLYRHIEDTRREVHELHGHIVEMQHDQQRNYDRLVNRIDLRLHDFEHLLLGNINDLRERFASLEDTVLEKINHVDELFENINLRFDYFNNRLHLINDKVEQSFPNKKTRLRKKLNLTYKFRRRRRLDK